MRAICWQGINNLSVGNVADPVIINPHDAILKVRYSSVCGSDNHTISGLLPGYVPGDILGHEFLGEVVEVGPEVKRLKLGDRVIVSPFHKCGSCVYCEQDMGSMCDNSNPKPHLGEAMFGYAPGGAYGFGHPFGGFAGAHAEYVRVPFADNDCFVVPDELPDEKALFISEAAPTGFMGADFCNIKPGDTIAVWGCGGVGLMAQKSAFLLGAGRVIAIDRVPERLRMAREIIGCETLNLEEVPVLEALKEMTGGRGPDACIEAVGMEAQAPTPDFALDKAKQTLRLSTDSAHSLREAIFACRKGGTLSVLGLFGPALDKFPMTAIGNKGLTVKSSQVFAHKYIPRLLEHAVRGELDPSFLMTHRARLEDAQDAYDMWRNKENGCVRVVFEPGRR